jgi:hypothetical protein
MTTEGGENDDARPAAIVGSDEATAAAANSTTLEWMTRRGRSWHWHSVQSMQRRAKVVDGAARHSYGTAVAELAVTKPLTEALRSCAPMTTKKGRNDDAQQQKSVATTGSDGSRAGEHCQSVADRRLAHWQIEVPVRIVPHADRVKKRIKRY